ncbi:MAG: DUF2786 domain-containing protein [bacterium]|nr:DUF2786 domain-containing protein [bacterium]
MSTEQKLHESWNRKLYHWWTHYNREYLSSALTRPVIRLSRSERELGHWNGTTRTLSVSQIHIHRDSWASVLETLRHEMAHQYAQEVLHAENEPPHGPAFKQACHVLRCNPRATASAQDLQAETDPTLLRRLKKLLSLSGSPNENEAQVAVQKARHLLIKYNIDLVELDRERHFSYRHLGKVKGRRTSAEIWLAALLNEFFFVEVIWAHSYDALQNRSGTLLQIFGTPENLDMADYVYHYLTNLLDNLWKDYKKQNNIRANRERQRYYTGVLEGFYRKLKEQEKGLQETQALVWKGDARLHTYYRYLNPRVHTRRGGGVSDTPAYRDGLQDGRNVTIHKPVREKGSGFGGHLTA